MFKLQFLNDLDIKNSKFDMSINLKHMHTNSQKNAFKLI